MAAAQDPVRPGTVLVLRFGSAGDLILLSPAMGALRSALPDARIVLAVKEYYHDLVRFDPHVDDIVCVAPGEGVLGLARRLREHRFDALLDLHGSMRSRAIRTLVPTRRTVTWTKRPWRDALPVRLGLRPYSARMPIADRYHAAVEKLVGGPLPRGELRHYVGEEHQAAADALFEARGVGGRPVVGLSPGAGRATKCWPVDRFGELARRLCDRGCDAVIVGSPDEAELARAIRRTAPEAVDLIGDVSLGTLGGVLSRCTAFVANDSGPMHMARALRVPTLVFFGSTDPKNFTYEGHRHMFAGVACSPCHFYGRHRCPRGHFRCMTELTVDDAWAALQELLSQGRAEVLHA